MEILKIQFNKNQQAPDEMASLVATIVNRLELFVLYL